MNSDERDVPDLSGQVWVLTGAAGRIGSTLRPAIAPLVGELRLVDQLSMEPTHTGETVVNADLRDAAAVRAALDGAYGVIHLGGVPHEADFHDLAESNIIATFNVLDGVRRCGVRRAVYASTGRTTGFYPTDMIVDPMMPPRPDSLYAASKVAGEAIGRLYADKFGIAFAALRIGSFQQEPRDVRQLSTWLSPADCLRAFIAAMGVPDLTYARYYAISANTRRWCSLDAGYAIGYYPQDDAEAFAYLFGDAPTPRLQGGQYTEPDDTASRQVRDA